MWLHTNDFIDRWSKWILVAGTILTLASAVLSMPPVKASGIVAKPRISAIKTFSDLVNGTTSGL